MADLHVRAARSDELDALAELWFISARDAHEYLPMLQALDAVSGPRVFVEHIAPGLEFMVCESAGALVGMLGLQGASLDRLYVAPSAQGLGLGSVLLARAKELRPEGLNLFTHQKNQRARRFYEARGFRPWRFGISPAPEHEPDVEYRWRPQEE